MALDDDQVVGDQAVAAIDQVERALALADAAVAEEQHADAVDVEQARVHASSRGAMVSSRKYVVRVIVVDDIAGVENSGTERFSHSTRNSSSGVMPLVTMKQEMSRPATSRMRFSRRRGGRLCRYFVSEAPMICTRHGLMYS